MDALLALDEEGLIRYDTLSITALGIIILLVIICLIFLQRQPTEQKKLSFKVLYTTSCLKI